MSSEMSLTISFVCKIFCSNYKQTEFSSIGTREWSEEFHN